MNDDVWIGKKNLRFWYYRYKDSPYFSFSIIGITIVVCLILIVQIIIPQLQTWFSIRDEVVATRERISVLRNNLAFMGSLDRTLLNTQLETATAALPPQKDFSAILNAIFESALQSGVSLGDFSFNVGNVSAAAAGKPGDASQKDLSSIEVTLVLSSNLDGAKRFLTKIKEKLPLSEVVKLEGNLQSTTVTIRFFQKPFAKIVYQDTQPLPPVSSVNQQLLQQLSGWKVSTQQNFALPSGTSAERIPLF